MKHLGRKYHVIDGRFESIGTVGIKFVAFKDGFYQAEWLRSDGSIGVSELREYWEDSMIDRDIESGRYIPDEVQQVKDILRKYES